MNALRIAPRCLGRPAQSSTTIYTPLLVTAISNQLCRVPPHHSLQQQVRHHSWFGWARKKDEEVAQSRTESRSLKEMLKASPKTTNTVLPTIERGSLSKSSIFDEEEASAEPTTTTQGGPRTVSDQEYLAIIDPKRAEQWSWPARFEARQYRRRGRLTKKLRILQTEKSHEAKSHWIKTSIKKLAPLARQIAGMKLNDAIVQMRFSPKKASAEVLGHLTEARTEAIVRRGMNPDEMYVDQAWVGRGTYQEEPSHRARGRIDLLRKPWTSITVVLKEQATRKRIAKEKEEKLARKKVWVQLPNRPLVGQRQYYQW